MLLITSFSLFRDSKLSNGALNSVADYKLPVASQDGHWLHPALRILLVSARSLLIFHGFWHSSLNLLFPRFAKFSRPLKSEPNVDSENTIATNNELLNIKKINFI